MREDSPDHRSGEAGEPPTPGEGAPSGGPAESAAPRHPEQAPFDWGAAPLEPSRFVVPPPLPAVGGLVTWLVLIVLFGAGGLLLGQQEMALLVAGGGLFVAAQAADLDRRWRIFYLMLAWVAPLGGAAALTGLGVLAIRGTLTPHARTISMAIAFAGAALMIASLLRPVSGRIARALFRTQDSSHTMRLAGRLVVLGFCAAIPLWFVFRDVFDTFFTDPSALFEQTTLGSSLVGYVLLALASVGFLVRRGFRDTLIRLGITPLGAVQLAVVAGGVIALVVLNVSADWIQHTYLPALWESDHKINQAIASGLGPAQVAMLGLSAGIGEEITMRGALQPRLGVVRTALLFASLHVQYSWFGMVVIFLLGLLLGVIRARTSTSVAIAVHTLYDVAAVFSV